MTRPSESRIAELKEIIRSGIEAEGRDLDDYYTWDDMVEVDEVMSYEEYHWCRENLQVSIAVTVEIKAAD